MRPRDFCKWLREFSFLFFFSSLLSPGERAWPASVLSEATAQSQTLFAAAYSHRRNSPVVTQENPSEQRHLKTTSHTVSCHPLLSCHLLFRNSLPLGRPTPHADVHSPLWIVAAREVRPQDQKTWRLLASRLWQLFFLAVSATRSQARILTIFGGHLGLRVAPALWERRSTTMHTRP